MATDEPLQGPLEAARLALSLTHQAVWIRYFAIGGNGSEKEVTRWLAEPGLLADGDHDLLTHALNEEFSAQGQNHPLHYRRGV